LGGSWLKPVDIGFSKKIALRKITVAELQAIEPMGYGKYRSTSNFLVFTLTPLKIKSINTKNTVLTTWTTLLSLPLQRQF